MGREQYEKDLHRRQKEHLKNIKEQQDHKWQPCLHDACSECLGTGIRRDGSMCIHAISCPCRKCSNHCTTILKEICKTTTNDNLTYNEQGNYVGFHKTEHSFINEENNEKYKMLV